MYIPETNTVLTARNLNVYFRSGFMKRDKKIIIHDFEIEIKKDQIIGLCGESGKGKTTLGKTLLGLHKYYTGDIYWQRNLLESKESKALRRKYSWMGQEPFMMFNPNWKIGAVLAETLIISDNKIRMEEATGIVKESCLSFNIDDNLLDRYPFELSAGQIQRFALIRNFLVKPDFLVLDEPVSSLDPYNAELFLNLLSVYREMNKIGILFISHNKSIIKSMTNDIVEL